MSTFLAVNLLYSHSIHLLSIRNSASLIRDQNSRKVFRFYLQNLGFADILLTSEFLVNESYHDSLFVDNSSTVCVNMSVLCHGRSTLASCSKNLELLMLYISVRESSWPLDSNGISFGYASLGYQDENRARATFFACFILRVSWFVGNTS